MSATRRCPRSRPMSGRSAAEVRQRLGPRAGLINPIVGTVFPEFLAAARHLAHLPRLAAARPRKDRGLVVGVRRQGGAAGGQARRSAWPGIRGFSPSGTFEQDDMDNWQECTQTCRGVVSRRMPLNNQMGLGHERFDPALGAWASDYRLQRKQPSPVLSALGRADGGGRLERAGMHGREGSGTCLTRT